MPTVWDNIDAELRRRRKSASWLGKMLVPVASRQTINGWKIRGVPAARHEELAKFFDWTVDRLLYGTEDAEAASVQAALDYSPQALHLARMLDDLEGDERKMRVYWKVTQLITTGDEPPWGVEPPTQPAPATASPAPLTTTKPRPVK